MRMSHGDNMSEVVCGVKSGNECALRPQLGVDFGFYKLSVLAFTPLVCTPHRPAKRRRRARGKSLLLLHRKILRVCVYVCVAQKLHVCVCIYASNSGYIVISVIEFCLNTFPL